MTCEHFDREGLARQEAGKPDPHVDGCSDCQTTRATYRLMTDALGDVGGELFPRVGWEDEVLAKVRAPSAGRRRPSRWWMGAGVGGALVAAAVIALVIGGRKPAPELASISRVAGGAVVRGGAADWTAGDTIAARSRAAGGAVWIYRGDALLLACSADTIAPPTCARDGAGVRTALVADKVGTYDVIAFDRAAPGLAPASVDEANALLIRQGLRPRTAHFDVR